MKMPTNKNNSGALFKEEEKKSEKHPDYKGDCLVNGERMYIAAWINTAEHSGKKYMSLSFSAPSTDANYSKDSTATPKPEFDKPQATAKAGDDLPF